jgi:thioredoxin 1
MAELDDVNDAGFEEGVMRSALPVLVDFWGEDCPSCRAISPILRELAAEYAGRLKIVKLHTGENAQAMARFRVMALPTVLAFAQGRVVGQLTGARPRAAFRELAERALHAAMEKR